MEIVEKIKTTKGCYSLSIEMGKDGEFALVSLTDSRLEHCIRLDNEDLKRIYLLLGDHLDEYNGEHGPL
jgi:hypothetical protein